MSSVPKLNYNNLSISELINVLIDIKEFNKRKIAFENDVSYVDIKHLGISTIYKSDNSLALTSISQITFHYIRLYPIRNWVRKSYWLEVNNDVLLYHDDLNQTTKTSMPNAERVNIIKTQIIEEINKY